MDEYNLLEEAEKLERQMRRTHFWITIIVHLSLIGLIILMQYLVDNLSG